jgi:membrane protein implicated in regulation of membrane protease activity
MTALADLFVNLGPWSWVIAGLILMSLETLVPGVHFLWFGISAVLVGIVAFLAAALGLGEAFSLPWQLVLFALVSVVAVFWVRGLSRHEQAVTDEPDLNVRGAQYIGRVVVVEDAISGGRGKVRVGDTLWPAQGSDTAKGARVKITGTNGTVFVVEPAV